MHESFFGLEQSPFGLTPDPDFLFFTAAHRNAAAGLVHAVMGQKGFSVITGDAGLGKTSLLRLLMTCLPPNRVRISFVLNPALGLIEFLQMALADFGIHAPMSNKAECLTALQQFLLQMHGSGKIAVLIIDDAHRLSNELLEEIRLLTKFETDKEKLLQIVLAGQDELDGMLDVHSLRQLKQLIAVRFHLPPLARPEVDAYVRHRWAKVSNQPAPFPPETLKMIADAAHGIPRVVNVICENSLLMAFAEEDHTVRPKHVAQVISDLRLAPEPVTAAKPVVSPPVPAPSGSMRELAAVVSRPARREEAPLPTLGRYAPVNSSWRLRLVSRWSRTEKE